MSTFAWCDIEWRLSSILPVIMADFDYFTFPKHGRRPGKSLLTTVSPYTHTVAVFINCASPSLSSRWRVSP